MSHLVSNHYIILNSVSGIVGEDQRTEIVASKLGPNEIIILKEIFDKGGEIYSMAISDAVAYSRLAEVGIVELNRKTPLMNERPTYYVTLFGQAVSDLLFKVTKA